MPPDLERAEMSQQKHSFHADTLQVMLAELDALVPPRAGKKARKKGRPKFQRAPFTVEMIERIIARIQEL